MKPFLSLWRLWLALAMLPVGLVVLCSGTSFLPGVGLPTCCVLFALSMSGLCWHLRWVPRFVAHTRCFRTERRPGVVLHYDPQLQRYCDLPALVEQVCAAKGDFEKKFGFVLRRVVVFLLDGQEPIRRALGRPAGGFAIVQCGAIVISRAGNLKESVRHELAHLFSVHWSGTAPPLFGEGLPVWLQGGYYGMHVDDAARRVLRRWRPRLSSLRKQKVFFGEQHCDDCYILAGSFTGFLIRRYGWAAYRRFYRKSHALNFNGCFRKVFGVSFGKAEWQWRTELDVMAALASRVRRTAFQE